MAITPLCDICTAELTQFGAILLSPPDNDGQVRKFHICTTCYKKLCKDNNITNSAKV